MLARRTFELVDEAYPIAAAIQVICAGVIFKSLLMVAVLIIATP